MSIETTFPKSPTEAKRWTHTRLRRRMLLGEHASDVAEALAQSIKIERSSKWGKPDLSRNPFRACCQAASTLYDEEPRVGHKKITAARKMTGILRDLAFAPTAQQNLQTVIGCNENLVFVGFYGSGVDAKIYLELVPADSVIAVPDPARPDQPIRVERLTVRDIKGKPVTCWEVWDRESKTLQIRAVEDDRDVTELAALDGAWPEAYTDSDGAPVMPFVVYHSTIGQTLWSPYLNSETVEGTLNTCVLYTFWRHIVLRASWPQRYIAGWLPAGMEQGGAGAQVEADPSNVLVLVADPNASGGGATAGQWGPGGDAASIIAALEKYEDGIATAFGLSPSDFRRARSQASGYRLELERESRARLERKYGPSMRRSDVLLMAAIAVLSNRLHSAGLPEGGYDIAYRGVPPSPTEIESIIARAKELLAMGLIDKVGAYSMIYGVSEAEARAHLESIDASREQQPAAGAGEPTGGDDARNDSSEADGETAAEQPRAEVGKPSA